MTTPFKSVNNLAGLAQFGINALTGEACAFSLRVLCDVNEDGENLLKDYFGTPGMQLADPWNSTVNGAPSVGSVMLPRSIAMDLATFALFRAGALAVVTTAGGHTTGIFDKERFADYEKLSAADPVRGFSILRNPQLGSHAPMQGSRNVHAATGRVL